MSNASLFDRIHNLQHQTRTIRVASPNDIVEIDEDGNGDERWGIREGAELIDIEVRPLTSEEKHHANAILDRAGPPPQIFSTAADGSRTMVRHDEDDPTWLASRRNLELDRAAWIAMTGTPELLKSTPGNTDAERIKAVREKLPELVIRIISHAVWNFGFRGGELADFFTSKRSGTTPSSNDGNTSESTTPTSELD